MIYSTASFKKKLGLVFLVILASPLVSPRAEGMLRPNDAPLDHLRSKKQRRSNQNVLNNNQNPYEESASETEVELDDLLGAVPTLGDINNLIEAAKKKDVEAQNKLIELYCNGSYCIYLTPEKIGFLNWKTMDSDERIQTRCARDDSYAFYFIVNFQKILPDLVAQVKERATQCHAGAQLTLGIMYATGRGAEKNEKEAFRLFKLAADQGRADAQNSLGHMYVDGRGVGKDEKEASRLYKLAADQGHASAQCDLGIMYANGQGVGKDEKEAFRLYKLAADQGHASAQCNLGFMYVNGQGVGKNEKEAFRLYKLAADQGHASAQCNLGNMYANGHGVDKDEKEACRLFKLSADQGQAFAQFNLGFMYATGQGVGKNLAAALVYHMVSKRAEAHPFLSSHLTVWPFVTDQNESFSDKLTRVLTGKKLERGELPQEGLVFLRGRYEKKITNEKKRIIFQVPELIDLYGKASRFARVAEGFLYLIRGTSQVGFMVPGLCFSQDIQNDYNRQTVPHQLDGWNIDGINYMTFGESNIKLRKSLIGFIENLDEKFSEADQALETLQTYYGKKDYDLCITELIAKRDNPELDGECEKLSERITHLGTSLAEFQKDREVLAAAKGMFKKFGTLIRSTARARQDKFCEEYPFIPKKG